MNHLLLNGLYIEDPLHDTLLYAGEATVNITDWFIFKEKPVLHYLGLSDAYIHLTRSRKNDQWNYDSFLDAFETKASTPSKKEGKSIELDLEKIDFKHVRFHMDDQWGGENVDIDAGRLTVNARKLDFQKKLIDIKGIDIDNTLVSIDDYKGGKPHKTEVDTVDTTPFNPDNWQLRINYIALERCAFRLETNSSTPSPGHFDERHIRVNDISLKIVDIAAIGDTIKGEAINMKARERCGLAVNKLHSRISVSPIASVCSELYFETDYSKIHNYYAMHYRRFPNFLQYIDSVEMVGRMDNSIVDTRDIAFFAPEMKQFPAVLHVSGEGRGTVAKLHAKHMKVSDGRSELRGDISMTGLPDIFNTRIVYENAECFTSGAGIFKYAPALKNNPDFTIEPISHAYFKGRYEGYIDNFRLTGVLTTNLGAVSTDITMAIPEFKSSLATYTGKIATENAQIGILLRRPLLGGLTCNEEVSGSAFDRDLAQINLDGNISEITFNQYHYRNINTHGTLSKKQFSGKLLVDDPNLALTFDGSLDYNDLKDVKIAATAHLLYANLKAINLTKDSVTSSADFDLNCHGGDIDNFLGYSRLYNIDLKRNAHKVAIDSIFLRASLDGAGGKSLIINSNLLDASINGTYQLSKLPSSVQYYLSKYIPNYINAPTVLPADQNLEFSITTRNIDSLLAVSLPILKGFDTSTLSGAFNTSEKKLLLNVQVPYGSIGNVHMSGISINGQGNEAEVALTTNISNISIGDSFINSSLSLTTTLANDSLDFTVATTAPNSGSSLALNGKIFARRDTLHLSVFPSQFYLNRTRWDIAGGSQVIYSSNFLDVQHLALTSGLQKITANSNIFSTGQSLLINTENLDLAQVGYWGGIASYQPEGRINGTITVEKLFNGPLISANIKATNVKLANDTLGTINLIGSYDGYAKLLTFDPQTGVYRDNSSITAAGSISLDTTSSQKLDGTINFSEAKVSWASPFLTGIFSHLSGNVNGKVILQGTTYEPVLKGKLELKDAGLKLDYMGCSYTIPKAEVNITNKSINWGTVQAFDIYNNSAQLTGGFTHNLFRDMKMQIKLVSDKFEAMRLASNENNLFYGNVIVSADSFTVSGPFNSIRMHAYNVAPAAKSHIYLPVPSSGDISTYSYVTFKNYGKNQEKPKRATPFKLDLKIEANFNDLAEMTIVLDPITGDAITAKGEGNIQLSIPPNNEMRITGQYDISEGTYDFTLVKVYHRQFQLSRGSKITFQGSFMETAMDVNGIYSKKARLYDLLTSDEIKALDPSELPDAKAPQVVNVLLHMRGTLQSPNFTYDLDLADKRSIGTYAYTKLIYNVNRDERQKTDQVGSFLLINSFLPSDGLGSSAGSAVSNNITQFLSGQASATVTSYVNKLVGDKKLNVDLLYNNYSFNDQLQNNLYNRTQFKVGVSHPFFNDRLTVSIGSTSDWGRQTSSSTSTTNFNITGDFRIQYSISDKSNLKLNAFRTSDYDVTLDKDISRSGVGISWRKSFDGFGELFRGSKYAQVQKKAQVKKENMEDTTGAGKGGTKQ